MLFHVLSCVQSADYFFTNVYINIILFLPRKRFFKAFYANLSGKSDGVLFVYNRETPIALKLNDARFDYDVKNY